MLCRCTGTLRAVNGRCGRRSGAQDGESASNQATSPKSLQSGLQGSQPSLPRSQHVARRAPRPRQPAQDPPTPPHLCAGRKVPTGSSSTHATAMSAPCTLIQC